MKEYYKVSAETRRAFLLFFLSIDTGLSVYVYNEIMDTIALLVLCVFIVVTTISIIMYFQAMDNLRESIKEAEHGIHHKPNNCVD